MLRIIDPAQATALRSLARFEGTAFVRTKDGSAYEADVQVKGLDVDGPILDASIEAHEVATSDMYKLPEPPQPEDDQIDYDDPVVPEGEPDEDEEPEGGGE